jgi:hypothetical protein
MEQFFQALANVLLSFSPTALLLFADIIDATSTHPQDG